MSQRPPENPPPGNQPPGGYGQPGQPYGGGPVPKRGKGMAVTALVLGVLGLLLSATIILLPLGALLGLIALILGLVASSKAKKGRAGGRAMAVIGWILGLLSLLVAGAVIALGAWLFDDASSLQECLEQAGTNQSEIDQCGRDFQDDVENKLGG